MKREGARHRVLGVIYCPYTGADIDETVASREHVAPLALGGADQFAVLACRERNSRWGSAIDGKLANDFFLLQRRNEFDVRGHSGKRPVLTIRNAVVRGTGVPVQVQLDKRDRQLRVYSPVDGRLLHDDETAGTALELRTSIEPRLYVKFAAKVALAAGYLCYGDLFRQRVEHAELRNLVQFDEEALRSSQLLASDFLTPCSGDYEKVLRVACGVFGAAVVALVPSRTDLTVAVGCLGEFVALVRVPAETEAFPNSGAFAWGHVFAVRERRLTRGSFQEALAALARQGIGARVP